MILLRKFLQFLTSFAAGEVEDGYPYDDDTEVDSDIADALEEDDEDQDFEEGDDDDSDESDSDEDEDDDSDDEDDEEGESEDDETKSEGDGAVEMGLSAEDAELLLNQTVLEHQQNRQTGRPRNVSDFIGDMDVHLTDADMKRAKELWADEKDAEAVAFISQRVAAAVISQYENTRLQPTIDNLTLQQREIANERKLMAFAKSHPEVIASKEAMEAMSKVYMTLVEKTSVAYADSVPFEKIWRMAGKPALKGKQTDKPAAKGKRTKSKMTPRQKAQRDKEAALKATRAPERIARRSSMKKGRASKEKSVFEDTLAILGRNHGDLIGG